MMDSYLTKCLNRILGIWVVYGLWLGEWSPNLEFDQFNIVSFISKVWSDSNDVSHWKEKMRIVYVVESVL